MLRGKPRGCSRAAAIRGAEAIITRAPREALARSALPVVLVVRRGFKRPEVRAHRCLAAGHALLRIERCEVRCLLARVFHTRVHCRRDGGELGSMFDLVCRYRCRTGHGLKSAKVHTIALAHLRRRCVAVRGQNHFLIHRVRAFLVDLRQRPA